MRGGWRKTHQEEEEESAFVSMTDMTVSFLIIIMILLAFFATQVSSDDTVPRERFDRVQMLLQDTQDELEAAREKIERLQQELREAQRREDDLLRQIADKDREIEHLRRQIERLEATIRRLQLRDPLEAYLTRSAEARLEILENIRRRLTVDFPDLAVEISNENDALRFRGEGLFATGQSVLAPRPLLIVQTISERLDEILPCYTFGPSRAWEEGCNPAGAVVEAVQIEGHTDSTGIEVNNLRLSTDRANATFIAMRTHTPDLIEHLNTRSQPVLSVAGYGQMRPIASNDTDEGRAQNRRIDLRIIMHTPSQTEEIERILERLRGEEDAP